MTGVRHIAVATLIAAIAAGTVSCSDNMTNTGSGSGALQVNIEVDPTIHAGGATSVPSDIVAAPQADDFDIYITDTEGKRALWTGDTSDALPELLLPGVYDLTVLSGTLDAEGFGTPCFRASTAIEICHGQTTVADVTATLANALIDIDFDSSVTRTFSDISASLHSFSGHYITYSLDEQRPAFIRPGDIMLAFNATMPDGRELMFYSLTLKDTSPATYYKITVNASTDSDGNPVVTARVSTGDEASVTLTPEFIASRGPELSSSGFTNNHTITLSEGAIPDEPLIVTVSSDNLAHLFFTAIAPTLGSAFTREMDLLNLSQDEADSLKHYGLVTSGLHRGAVENATVDLTELVRHLRYVDAGVPSTMSLLAVDVQERISPPLILSVETAPVELNIESVSDAIIGVNTAQMLVRSSTSQLDGNLTLQAFDAEDNDWTDLTISSIEHDNGNLWAVNFTVPDGVNPVIVRVFYCSKERDTFTVKRASPSYSIAVDPFALHADIIVEAEDERMTGIVTSAMQIYTDDGKTRLQLLERYPSEGRIKVSGLEAGKNYSLRPTLVAVPGQDDFGPTLNFKTENATQFANGDFERVVFDAIKYADMPSGGRYSQNIVEIYNRQNRTSFDLKTPASWCTVNAKTFCRLSTNHNTWYLAPSTYIVEDAASGAYAVRLDCVGYDTHGADIPDYVQTSQPYTPYSLNVPSGYSRAAGRLFLGNYSYDAETETEQYDEGIAFDSRPSALNGFYKYLSTSANPGATAIARIEVMGDAYGTEIVIARGEKLLPPALSYTAFTIPLAYQHFGVKATHLRILFAASSSIGDIESETEQIIVIPYPETSTFLGSSLWLDNLSLSY